MTALIPLARCLSAHRELLGDLWPADPEVGGVVDERIKLCLCCVTRRPGAVEPFQDLCRGLLGRPLRRARGLYRLPLGLVGSSLPPFVYRLAPRLAHAINDAGLPTTRVSQPAGPKGAGTEGTRVAVLGRTARNHAIRCTSHFVPATVTDRCWRTPAVCGVHQRQRAAMCRYLHRGGNSRTVDIGFVEAPPKVPGS
jgi:hypothetical protein